MSPEEQVQAALDQVLSVVFFFMWLIAGVLIVRKVLRIYRTRQDMRNAAPQPDTLPYRNARNIAEWERKRIERRRTGAEP